MRRREKFVPYMEYQEAFEKFTEMRKEVNDCVEKTPEKFNDVFDEIKFKALYGNVAAMDVLAYFYKTGIPKYLPENYNRYIAWQFLAAGKGNKFAIDKLQFLINGACEKISEHENFDDMVYYNDMDEENAVYVLGKALCKIITRDFMNVFPIDIAKMDDIYEPYSQEAFINLRKMIDEAVEPTCKYLLS